MPNLRASKVRSRKTRSKCSGDRSRAVCVFAHLIASQKTPLPHPPLPILPVTRNQNTDMYICIDIYMYMTYMYLRMYMYTCLYIYTYLFGVSGYSQL